MPVGLLFVVRLSVAPGAGDHFNELFRLVVVSAAVVIRTGLLFIALGSSTLARWHQPHLVFDQGLEEGLGLQAALLAKIGRMIGSTTCSSFFEPMYNKMISTYSISK